MSKLSPEQLDKLDPQNLKPVLLVTGDDPLLSQESCEIIRAKARQSGFTEREIFHTDSSFQWSSLLQCANSMSLFAEKKLIELRIHNGKPGEAGTKVIQEYCSNIPDDNLLLIISPKLERAAQNSKWYKAVDSVGSIITIWPVDEQQMPRWIGQRLKRAGIRADSEAIDILSGRVEGNLLAAVQEIEKLKLIADSQVIDAATMANAVVDSARYNIFGLVDKALAGNPKTATATLNGLRGEGSEPTVILWALTREIRTLLSLKELIASGQRLEHISKKHGVFDKKLPLIRGALQRLSHGNLKILIRECGYADRAIKGAASADPWNVILDIVLTLSGTRCLSGKSLQALLNH